MGLFPEFYLKKNGFEASSVDTASNEIINYIQSPVNKNNLLLYLSFGVNMTISSRVNLIIEPYYLQSLSSFYRNNLFIQKF